MQKMLIFSLIICFQITSFAQNLKNDIEKALREGAIYTEKVLLDKNGKARGDYDWLTGTWHEYEAMWHTGQLIWGLLEAYEVLEDKKILKVAEKAGNWWVAQQFTDKNSKLFGMVNAIHGGEIPDLINFTTVADGTPALFLLSKFTKNPKYAQTATEAGKWLLENTQTPQKGLYYNFIDKQGNVLKDKSPHKQHEGKEITLQMVARPNVEGFLFLDMYRFTQKESYKKTFLEQCDFLIENQSENGFWMNFEPNNPETGQIHPRFNIWNAEALLEAYQLTKEDKYLQSALRTAQAMAKIQRKNGIIYYQHFADGRYRENSITGSAISFAGVLWLKLYNLGYKDFQKNIDLSLQWVLKNRFLTTHPDKNLAGGFFETRSTIKDNNQVVINVRDIATAFALRFLADYHKTFLRKN